MKKVLACMLVVMLLASCLSMAVVPVSAQDSVPSTDEEIEEVARAVLSNEIMLYLRATYFGEGINHLSLEELRESASYYPQYPRQITDSADRTVTIYKPVERIILQPTASYEPVWVIGAQDKVVGVTTTALKEEDYSWLPGIQDKPPVGAYKELDYEKIMELEPDIVISSKSKAEETSEKLEPAGITVVALNFVEIEKFDSELKILAKILGKDEKAEEFISWRQNHFDLIKERTEGIEPKVRVYVEYPGTLWGTGGEGSSGHSVITTAGGYNIAGDEVGYFGYVDQEWVAKENPEVIFFPAFAEFGQTALTGYFMDSHENAEQFIEEACNRTGLKETDAVSNGSVYVIDGCSTLAACRSIIAALYCAKWFYPKQFEDLEPEKIHREYFEEWLDVEYKGIWVYPLLD